MGIGSDFDGIGSVPEGLEDVSKYPNLVGFLHGRPTAFILTGLSLGC